MYSNFLFLYKYLTYCKSKPLPSVGKYTRILFIEYAKLSPFKIYRILLFKSRNTFSKTNVLSIWPSITLITTVNLHINLSICLYCVFQYITDNKKTSSMLYISMNWYLSTWSYLTVGTKVCIKRDDLYILNTLQYLCHFTLATYQFDD